jgi:hypothetical protein
MRVEGLSETVAGVTWEPLPPLLPFPRALQPADPMTASGTEASAQTRHRQRPNEAVGPARRAVRRG